MASGRLLRVLLAAALLGAAFCQDGLTCNNAGETWRHQCNTCSCRDGVTVCTKDVCSIGRNPIISGSCLAGSKWKDGCGNTCLCDPSGKTRCTVGPCPPRVDSQHSMTFVRTDGDPCAAGDAWKLDCNSCSCVDGKAVCTAERCPRQPPQAPETCEPDERWEDECGNRCECTTDRVPACTMLSCGSGQRAGVRRRPILRSGDECQNEGERWQQDCNECDCSSGVVSCTRRLCPQWQQPDKYGECQAGTRWVDECDNLCHCTDRGVPACTLKECPYGRREGVVSHFLLDDGATCSNEGELWEQGCSRCRCAAGRVSCSHGSCSDRSRTSAPAEPEWLTCREDTTWEDECGNICSCWQQQPLCTRMGCPKGRIAGKPVKFITFEGDSCSNEGASWKEECNTCTCTGGAISCTKKFCSQQRQSVRFVSPFTAMTCTPGQRWVDECDNTCFCPESGHSACTMMACAPGKRPMVPVRYIYADGDSCTDEGSSWRHECNTCRCSEGRVACTKRPCPGVRRPLLRSPLLDVGAEPGSDKRCEEGTEWTDECDNHCRCTDGGLVTCTLKVCPPGKQAGRPRQLRPKLGEPCETGGDETWLDDCNTCQCVDGVTACTRATCRPQQQALDGVPVQQCRPGSSWLDECDNHCHCNELGLSYCTLKACPYGRQYGVPNKFVRSVNDTCTEEGASWRQDCNTCNCTDGRVDCTKKVCEPEAGVRARFGPRGLSCLPGSKWTDQCENTCRCTSSGQAACSLKACPPGKKAGVKVRGLPQAGDSCDTEGRSWKVDCNRCTCTDGRVQCTEKLCSSLELPVDTEGPCTEGEEWIDECSNRCKCIEGEPRCTRRPCQAGGRPGVPVRFVVPDGGECDNDGEQWQEACNTCRCDSGRVVCTKKTCVGFERGGGTKKPGNCPYVPLGTLGVCINGCNGDDMCPVDEKCCSNGCGAMCMKPNTCLEGIGWEEDCNTCACINGEPACTKRLCAKDRPQFDASAKPQSEPTCLEGSVWKKDCNTCDCVNGKELCTKMLCPSNTSPFDEVTGECREDSVWNKDCNRCRCINGRAVCTVKQCGPGVPQKGNGGSAQEDICSFPPVNPDKEECLGFIRRWTYDAKAGKCRRYIYGGCHGTQNLFRTKKQCKRRCGKGSTASRARVCRLPADTGTCFDIIPRYFFDQEAGKCRQFGFSGCGGNENNFAGLAECIRACGGTYTVEDKECDRRRCPWSLYKHYTDQGCEPVYENDACCPTRFDCPEVRGFGDEACMYRGQKYPVGATVAEASKLDPCKTNCVCTSSPGTGPRIDCGEVDCPAEMWNQISAGCLPLYLPDRCCPVSVRCPSRQRRSARDRLFSSLEPTLSLSGNTHTCQANGRTYVEGELMPVPGDPCTTCVCAKGYRVPDGDGCRRTDCMNFTVRLMTRGCVPVYKAGVCCPVDWKCPDEMSYRTLPVEAHSTDDAPASRICSLPKKRGPCSSAVERYLFDPAQRRCVPFIYGGCEGNENNFPSLAECDASCGSGRPASGTSTGQIVALASARGAACLLPTVVGSCSERLLRFSYDPNSGTCRSFEYSGCGGNANSFTSIEECQNTCVPTDSQEFCYLPPETGRCLAAKPRYFYNSESGICEKFIYGGCEGNGNNFRSEEECYNKCEPGSRERKRRIQRAASMCLSAPDPGPCRSFHRRYFFNSETASCHPFKFGGCLGNKNNFASKEECAQQCGVLDQYLTGTKSNNVCTFGNRTLPRGTWLDIRDKCSLCNCLAPPALTCIKLHCPQMPSGQESLCHYRQRDPETCCPELVCDRSAQVQPNPSPGCALEQCHLPEARPGCNVVYRPGECCPELECLHPMQPEDREEVYQCEPVDCPASCRTGRDLYGCPVCDCSSGELTSRGGGDQPRCQRQFCPVGCPSHYENGCIVCECELPTTSTPTPTTPPTRPPCVRVTCRPGCGYRQDGRGCTVCDCRQPEPTPPPPPPPAGCPPVSDCPADCRPGLVNGCPACDCDYGARRAADLEPQETRRCPALRCPPGQLPVAAADGCSRCAPAAAERAAVAGAAARCVPCPCAAPEPAPARLAALSTGCQSEPCPARCDVSLDGRGCPVCSCAGAGRPGCAKVVCPAGCRTHADPTTGCPVCQCDLCPPCSCPAPRPCPTAVCPADCPRELRDGCYHCVCDDARPLSTVALNMS